MQILIQIAGFLILFFVLKKYLWRPLLNIIATREKEVRDTYTQAENVKREVETLRAEYETKIANISEEAQKRLAEEIKKGQEMAQEIVTSARKQAKLEEEKAMNAIREETIKSKVQLKDYTIQLAFDMAAKIMREKVDLQTHERLTKQFLNEIEVN